VIVVPLDGGMALRELYDTDEERDQLTGELIARGFHRVLLKDETESETEPG